MHFFMASMSSPFATCTELGVVVSCTYVQYFSALRFPKFPEVPLSKIAVLTIIVWGYCCSEYNRVCCYSIVYGPTPSGGRVVVLVTSALLVLEGGVVDVSCCLVFQEFPS